MRSTIVNDRINKLLLLVSILYLVVNNNYSEYAVVVFGFNKLSSLQTLNSYNCIHRPTSLLNHQRSICVFKNQSHRTVRLSLVIDPVLLANTIIDTPITTTTADPATIATMNDINDIGMLSKETTTIIFIIGIIPFIIATYEFWRRIAIGATFGTGTDSIVFPTTIGEENAPSSSRGKQVLGQDSLIAAYVIFTTVAIVLGIVFYAVLTSPPV
jgi:hypothetical protein